jgi:aryl sulfotransferase
MNRYQSFVNDSARWESFEFRPGDIVIDTPPKAGTTWMQRICSLLVFATPHLDKPLTTISPWLDMLTRPLQDVLDDLEAQSHRRFVKTHIPLDGLPFDERVTYICVGRDPRDLALSWDNHMANADFDAVATLLARQIGEAAVREQLERLPPLPESERERFWAWVDDPTPVQQTGSSLRAVLNLLASFWTQRDKPNVVLLHYDDLKADLEGQMRALARRLSIQIPEDRWAGLVKAATFDEMRSAADTLAPAVTESAWRDNTQFFHRGSSGQWRGLLDETELERYHARVRELAQPDLIEWLHRNERAA